MDPVRELEEIAAKCHEYEGRKIEAWLDRYGPLIAAAVKYASKKDVHVFAGIEQRDLVLAYRSALEKGEPK